MMGRFLTTKAWYAETRSLRGIFPESSGPSPYLNARAGSGLTPSSLASWAAFCASSSSSLASRSSSSSCSCSCCSRSCCCFCCILAAISAYLSFFSSGSSRHFSPMALATAWVYSFSTPLDRISSLMASRWTWANAWYEEILRVESPICFLCDRGCSPLSSSPSAFSPSAAFFSSASYVARTLSGSNVATTLGPV